MFCKSLNGKCLINKIVLSHFYITLFVLSGMAYADVPVPLIYLPFDGDWLNYGATGYGEEATLVSAGGSTPQWSPDGIKGQCYDITSATGTENDQQVWTGCAYWGDPSPSINTELELGLCDLKSYTVTFWVNPAGQLSSGIPLLNAHIMDKPGGGEMEIFWNTKPRSRVNFSTWTGVCTEGIASADRWTFYAVTYDSTVAQGEITAHWYMANLDEASTYENAFRELSTNSLYNTNNGNSIQACSPLIIGNRYLDGHQGMDGMLDEFRIFGSKVDSSGALSLDQIREVMSMSVPQIPCTELFLSDLNEDCYIDIKDLSFFAADWLDDTDDSPSDFDNNHYIDFADFAVILPDFGKCTDQLNASCDRHWRFDKLASKQWHDWRKSWTTFPIAAWCYFERLGATAQEYITYENANLTMVQSPLAEYDTASAAGLRPLPGTWENLYHDHAKLEDYVEFSNTQTVAYNGYLLKDEPDPNEFNDIGQAHKYIYQNDNRGSLPIVDLFAIYTGSQSKWGISYEDYVDLFIWQSFPAVLLNSHYPLLADGNDRWDYYKNMEIFRDRALAHDIGLMGFVLITPHGDYPDASESDLRWQVYSHITYGAKGLWYYNYHSAIIAEPEEGMVSRITAMPTERYYRARAINSELIALGPTLMKLKSKGVYHTSPIIPADTTGYTNGVIESISNFAGDDFLLGEFENSDETADHDVYLMVTNKRHARDANSIDLPADATFTVNPVSLNAYRYNPVTGATQLLTGSNGTYTETVNGGQGVLFRFSTNVLP